MTWGRLQTFKGALDRSWGEPLALVNALDQCHRVISVANRSLPQHIDEAWIEKVVGSGEEKASDALPL